MSRENYENSLKYEDAFAFWFLENGCTVRKASKEEDCKLKYDAVVKDKWGKVLDTDVHKIDFKSMHWSYKQICGTKALWFEADKHAGLAYNFIVNPSEYGWYKVPCTSEATDILFGLADTHWTRCLLVKRDHIAKYVTSFIAHGTYVTKGSSGNTLVWLPLETVEQLAWQTFDMSGAFSRLGLNPWYTRML